MGPEDALLTTTFGFTFSDCAVFIIAATTTGCSNPSGNISRILLLTEPSLAFLRSRSTSRWTRLLGPIGDVPPTEFEAKDYEQAAVA